MAVRKDKVQVEVEINGKVAGQTLKDLRSEVRQLDRELANLTPGTEAFNKKAAELRAAKARLSEVRSEVEGTGKEMTRLQEITGKLKGLMAVAFAAIAAAAVAVGAKIAEIVINSEQVERKFRQVFGDAAGIVDDFAKKNATSLGLTSNEFKDLASAAGDLLVPLGLTRTEAANMSVDSVKLAGALSQWTNGTKSVAEVSEILTKAMLGEKDGLQSLGIKITESELQARLLERGQAKLTGTMLEQAKALVTHELILEKSKDAQNAFENGADTMAQKVTKAKAQMSELANNLAQQFAPAISGAISWFAKLTGSVSAYGQQKFSDKLNEERMSVNALVRSITQQAEGSELRNKLIGQLQAQYPSFLGNINAETATNGQLLSRLKEVNEEYRKKILISAQDEIVKDVLEKQKNALVDMAKWQKLANEGFGQLKEAGANIDLNAPLEKQFEQYKGLVNEWQSSGMSQANIAKAFFGGDEVEMARTLAKVEGSVMQLIGSNEQYQQSTRALGDETSNYNKLLQQMGLSLEEVNKLMGDGADQTGKDAAAAAASAATLEKRKKDQAEFAANMKSAVENIQDLQIQLLEDPFEQKRAQLNLDTDRKIAALVGTPEQVATQTQLLKDALFNGYQEIAVQQSNAIAEQEAIRVQHDQASLQQQLAQMQAAQAAKELQLDLEFSTIIEAGVAHEQELYDLRQAALEERYQLLVTNGQAETELARQIEVEKLNNQIAHNQAVLKNEQETAKTKEAIQKVGLQAMDMAFQIGIEFLQRDIAARKKKLDEDKNMTEAEISRNRKALERNAMLAKAFTIGKIFVDLATEVAGYMASPASISTGGVTGGILSGLATIRAGLAASQVQNQEFAKGGLIRAGIPTGPRHADGGIKLTDGRTGMPIGEMEGGEPIMVLSRNLYSNNRNVVDRLLYSSLYNGGAPIFEQGGIIPSSSRMGTASQGADQGMTSPQLQQLIAEISALRADINAWPTSLRAHVVFNELQDAQSMDDLIRGDSRLI